MIVVWAVIVLMFSHWIADFVFQPDWMGKGKSKSWSILANHSSRITAGSALCAALIMAIRHPQAAPLGLVAFAGINGASHFAIDAVTSRVTSRLYAQGDHHSFFVVIGFDQFLHMTIAVLALWWLIL